MRPLNPVRDSDTWLLVAAGLAILSGGAIAVNTLSGKLSIPQLLGFAGNAGFTGPDLAASVAIAMAESGGNPQAHGDLTLGSGKGSFGLWQIYADAHPEYGPNFSQLFDPQTNANAAFAIYQQAGYAFTPWSTYKSGAYLAFLSAVQAAIA
jgi:Lysozyme like domain